MIYDRNCPFMVPCQVQIYTFYDISEHLSFDQYRIIKKTDWAIGSSPDGAQKNEMEYSPPQVEWKKSGDIL